MNYDNLFERMMQEGQNEPVLRQKGSANYNGLISANEIAEIKVYLKDKSFKERVEANEFAKKFVDLIVLDGETDNKLWYCILQVAKKTSEAPGSLVILKDKKNKVNRKRMITILNNKQNELRYESIKYNDVLTTIMETFTR